MITGSLAAEPIKIDRITKRKSDIVILLSAKLPGAHGSSVLERIVVASPLGESHSFAVGGVAINAARQSFLLDPSIRF